MSAELDVSLFKMEMAETLFVAQMATATTTKTKLELKLHHILKLI